MRVKFHCNSLTTVQDIQHYVSLIFGTHCSTAETCCALAELYLVRQQRSSAVAERPRYAPYR